MAIVIDASVALKWVLAEEGSDEAQLLYDNEQLVAPDLFFVECANVLWTKTRKFKLKAEDAVAGMSIIDRISIRSISGRPHVTTAQRISFEIGQSAYNSLYLAVAMAEGIEFVTADIAFSRAAKAHPKYAQWVRPLS